MPTQSTLAAQENDKDTPEASQTVSSPGTAVTDVSTTPSSPANKGSSVLPFVATSTGPTPTPFKQANFPAESDVTERNQQEPIPHSLPPSEPQVPENTHLPAVFAVNDNMATMTENPTHAGTVQDPDHVHDQDDSYLADRAGGLSLAEQGQSDGYDRDVNDIVNDRKAISNGGGRETFGGSYDHEPVYQGDTEDGRVKEEDMLDSPYDNYPNGEQPHESRPSMSNRPSRSYMGPQIPIVTTYEEEAPENASVRKQKRSASRASHRDYAGEDGHQIGRPASRAASTRPAAQDVSYVRSPSRAQSMRDISDTGRPKSIRNAEPEHVRAPSRSGSVAERPRSRVGNAVGAGVGAGGGAVLVGEVISPDRQRALQERPRSRVSLHDDGPTERSSGDRDRTMSPNRPQSSFGHRPQPNLMTVAEDGRESRYESGRDSRGAGVLGRSGTVMSRANTMGRNGTLSRAANGGTVGSRRGAFGRGAGASIGTQPEEVLGRDDIHARAELSERILDEATLRRLSTMEKKDAKRLAKVIKAEGKAETKAVTSSIKELERIVKLQKEAAGAERKSQLRLTKWTSKEHKARLRFLKEKERYEKIEAELRNAENDYEERRDHAGGLTAQVAEKTQDLDDLRGQKAADDREREVKLLALKNPAHS